MKRTMGIVTLLAIASGCSSVQPSSDYSRGYYDGRAMAVPGPATPTWSANKSSLPREVRYSGTPVPAVGPVPNPRPSALPSSLPAATTDLTAQAPAGAVTTGALAANVPVSHSGPAEDLDQPPPPAPVGLAPPALPQAKSDQMLPPPNLAPLLAASNNDPLVPAARSEVKAAKVELPAPKAAKVELPAPKAADPLPIPEPVAAPSDPAPPSLPEPVVPPADVKPGVMVLDHQASGPRGPAVRMVNTKRITINYELKNVGPSGVSGVELWYTQDGKAWKKRDVSSQVRPPYIVEVNEEGLYGFTLLAKNGIGLSKEPPQPGDLPQIWVEVDLTNPVVHLTGVNASCTSKAQNVIIRWTAQDKNLAPRPITLSYAPKVEGPWTTIATNVPNTGRYVWPLPAEAPARFVVRVEARDSVGNVGSAQTPKPVLLDRSLPDAEIITVDSDGK